MAQVKINKKWFKQNVCFGDTLQLYAALRVIVGTGFGGTMVVNSVYTIEFVGKRWRTLCGTIGFWGIGGMSLALIVRFLTIIQAHILVYCHL